MRKDLLNIRSLTTDEILPILDNAKAMKEIFTRTVKKVPALNGKMVLNLFFEPSTRTRTSFEIAAKRLSADVTNFTASSSSVVKGESILDTVDTMQSMKVDYIIVRHAAAGVPNMIARHSPASVINAGDGYHSHPTQALLDAFTIREITPEMTGKKILIVGDILHSRVARSVSNCCHMLGMKVAFFGPSTLIPEYGPAWAASFSSFEDALTWKPDFIYLLRLQTERMRSNFFPSMREYHHLYGVTKERFQRIQQEGIWVMHPGPVNRGVEVNDAVMDYDRCLINQQVENGIATRMAILMAVKPHTLPREQG